MANDSNNDLGVIERQQRRELRGSILRVANDVYGRDVKVTRKNILYVVGAEFTGKVDEEIKYLISKGYLEREAKPRDHMDKNPPEYFALTVSGRELFTGDRSDDAIEM